MISGALVAMVFAVIALIGAMSATAFVLALRMSQ